MTKATVYFVLAAVLLCVPGASAEPKVHRVVRGDTLHSISKRWGVELEDVRRWNELDSNLIYPGQQLVVSEPEPEPELTEYVVKQGDSLSQIAIRFDVGLEFLRQLNRLKGSRIYPGQVLKIRPTTADESVYVVQSGDSLSKIAGRLGIDLDELRQINGIQGSGSRIYPGQKLRVKAVPAAVHVVERGDALWEIAKAYDMTVGELKDLNGLRSSRIYPGQELKLRPGAAALRNQIYTVQRGDSLSEIAQLHQMSLAELKSVNQLKGNVIHPGQKLEVRPILGPGGQVGGWLHPDQIDWASLVKPPKNVRTIVAETGPYFFHQPRAAHQRGKNYYEGSRMLPSASYQRAAELWNSFERRVDRLGRLSQRLDGWHIVLDPGHGGRDPGTIVKTNDGKGNTLYIVEDEYVYDIAMRAYVLLRLHGAQVTLTVLSPNHLFRENAPATRTFVHEKNEVYNDARHNRRNHADTWPHGGYKGLRPRVEIAKKAFAGVSTDRTIFLSLHADNAPKSNSAPAVLYYERGNKVDRRSKNFAQQLLPALGAGSQTRGQRLGVLSDNPASVKVLVEVRNLAHAENAWSLRFAKLRQRDAEKIVKGILDYCGRQGLTAAR